jgi:membrane protease YdiL (CAAX protease family)
MNTEQSLSAIPGNKEQAKRFAVVALALWLLSGIPITIALMLKTKLMLALSVLFMHWGLPFIVAFKYERRGAASLGLSFKREDIGRYVLYIVAGFIAIEAIHLGERFLRIHLAGESPEAWITSRSFLEALVIQLLTVAVPEEVLYRGFLMTRLCDWLGKTKGLLWSALIFGAVHSFSRLSWQGGDYAVSAALIGCGTFLGGLIFGFQYLKTRSIIPSAVTHILLNLALAEIVFRLV